MEHIETGSARILIIEDSAVNINLLRGILNHARYSHVMAIMDPSKALETIKEYDPDLILLDLHMPKIDGYAVLEEIRRNQCEEDYLPILVLTSDNALQSKQRALDLGASDFITRPANSLEVLLRIRSFLKMKYLHQTQRDQNSILDSQVNRRTQELSIARTEALMCLARAAEYRDDDTGEHARRVGEMSKSLALELEMDPEVAEMVHLVAPLHDIGKIGISDEILRKPGKLDIEEFEAMKKHTVMGAEIIGECSSPLLTIAKDIALHHHERWDGKGYPDGLAGEEISLISRIVCLADTFDALRHVRPYKKAWSLKDTKAEIDRSNGTQFDPRVVEAFHRVCSK